MKLASCLTRTRTMRVAGLARSLGQPLECRPDRFSIITISNGGTQEQPTFRVWPKTVSGPYLTSQKLSHESRKANLVSGDGEQRGGVSW